MKDIRDIEKEKGVMDFFKAAFIVDGEVKLVNLDNFKIKAAIELNDSERGKFYIGLLEHK